MTRTETESGEAEGDEPAGSAAGELLAVAVKIPLAVPEPVRELDCEAPSEIEAVMEVEGDVPRDNEAVADELAVVPEAVRVDVAVSELVSLAVDDEEAVFEGDAPRDSERVAVVVTEGVPTMDCETEAPRENVGVPDELGDDADVAVEESVAVIDALTPGRKDLVGDWLVDGSALELRLVVAVDDAESPIDSVREAVCVDDGSVL